MSAPSTVDDLIRQFPVSSLQSVAPSQPSTNCKAAHQKVLLILLVGLVIGAISMHVLMASESKKGCPVKRRRQQPVQQVPMSQPTAQSSLVQYPMAVADGAFPY